MKAPTLRAAALTLACFASSAAAQSPGTVELGLFAQASYFDQSLRMEQARGGPGVRLGIFALPNIDLEAEGAFVPTEGPDGQQVYYIPLRGRVVLNIPAGEHGSFLLGGGYVRNVTGTVAYLDEQAETYMVLADGELLRVPLRDITARHEVAAIGEIDRSPDRDAEGLGTA